LDTLTSEQFHAIQVQELGYWQHTHYDPRGPWYYYDRAFLPYLGKMGIVADVGCGPVPYLCNHNLRYDYGYAIDPLIEKYYELEKYDAYRCRACMRFESTEEVATDLFDAVFVLNTLDHAQNPESLMLEIGRILEPGGKLFLFVDLDKPPDNKHPHTITKGWMIEQLSPFVDMFCKIEKSWKFPNDVLYYFGVKR
jgi:SAM-dependent methyltransferase